MLNHPLVARGARRGLTVLELVIVLVIITILAMFFLPGVRRCAREAARRTQCKNNLKQLGIALHNYHDVYGCFPPAYTVDKNGKRLHSWRTVLLPYAGESELYRKIDLAKPWNHPLNVAAGEMTPSIFRCPSAGIPDDHTTYVGVVSVDGFFAPDGSTRRIHGLTDGTNQTIAIFELPYTRAVHWMSPNEDELGLTAITQATEADRPASSHAGGFQAVHVDGSTRFFSHNMSQQALRAMLTIAGGEQIEDLGP